MEDQKKLRNKTKQDDWNRTKFYQKKWVIWACLVILAPLGIFLLWKYSGYKNSLKITLTIIFVLLAIWGPVELLSGSWKYGALAPSEVYLQDAYLDDSTEYAYIKVTNEDLKAMTNGQYHAFIQDVLYSKTNAEWFSVIIDNHYVLHYPLDGTNQFYYGLVGSFGQAMYPILIARRTDVILTDFLDSIDGYNSKIAKMVQDDSSKREQSAQRIISNIVQGMEDTGLGIYTSGMHVEITDGGVYQIYVNEAWMNASDRTKWRFLNIVYDDIKEANKIYIGNEFLFVKAYDINNHEVAVFDYICDELLLLD